MHDNIFFAASWVGLQEGNQALERVGDEARDGVFGTARLGTDLKLAPKNPKNV